MEATYIERTLEPVLKKAAAQFPAVMLSGPRQSGKTTVLKHVFGTSHRYVSLEAPDLRLAAETDPRGFLDLFAPPVIMDEVQYAPDLLSYVKERIDLHREKNGQYLLTGSQNLLLHEKISESLAGRAAVLRLLPLSRRERTGRPQAPLPGEGGPRPAGPACGRGDLWAGFLRGGYPELIAHPEKEAGLWFSSYVQTYLERDVRSLRQVGDLGQFQRFLRALAARSAQLLNLAELARDLGIAVNTAKQWLSVLEATHQVVILRPYFANLGRRLVKTPKVYFTDVGLLCHLVGLRDAEHAMHGPMNGPLMETAVVGEVLRTYWHRGAEPQAYFWRTSTGVEVDLLVDTGDELIPVEIKSTATPTPGMARSLTAFRTDLKGRVGKGFLVHSGEETLPVGRDILAWPFAAL
jgi:predicted AAA+ superfamily ATPase